MNKMFAIFKPINNSIWFDLREVIIDWDEVNMKIIKVSDYEWDLNELPVFTPLNNWSILDFYKQFGITPLWKCWNQETWFTKIAKEQKVLF